MLVAIGPIANAALAGGHPDLELIDELQPAASVCMFDVCDEVWWPQVVLRMRELPKPRWLVLAADPWRYRPLMRGIARDLHACVVVARPTDLLRGALLPLAGLVRVGLIGVDLDAVVEACGAPSIAFASFDLDEEFRSGTISANHDWRNWRTDSGLLVIRDPHTSLSEINALCELVSDWHRDASIVVTAPLFDDVVHKSLMACGWLAVEQLSR